MYDNHHHLLLDVRVLWHVLVQVRHPQLRTVCCHLIGPINSEAYEGGVMTGLDLVSLIHLAEPLNLCVVCIAVFLPLNEFGPGLSLSVLEGQSCADCISLFNYKRRLNHIFYHHTCR